MRKANMHFAIGKALTAARVPIVLGLSWVAVEMVERLRCYRRSRRERAQLLAMGERELRDLGLSRVDALRFATQLWDGCAKRERSAS